MNKAQIKKIKEAVFKKDAVVFDRISKQEKTKLFSFCEGYKAFLNNAKTERKAVKQIVKQATANGFKDIETLLKQKKTDKKPTKVFKVFQGKYVAMAVFGKDSLG
ncbi:MAG: aminopeptidase, partial [Desulfobacteraceae bacterium]|nr:aminopeptidase [Desulfobacteraceae bacterium]